MPRRNNRIKVVQDSWHYIGFYKVTSKKPLPRNLPVLTGRTGKRRDVRKES